MSNNSNPIKPLSIGTAHAQSAEALAAHSRAVDAAPGDALRQVRELLFGEEARRHETGLEALTSRITALEAARADDARNLATRITDLETQIRSGDAASRKHLAAGLRALADDLDRVSQSTSGTPDGATRSPEGTARSVASSQQGGTS